ncbi:MAG: RNA polymerase sigma factor [Bacteroidota bacterium]
MNDKETIGLFFQSERGKLRNYVRKFIRESSDRDADDVIQDVALNIFNKVDFSTPVENIAAYVYRSLRNKVIDLLRSKKNIISHDDITDQNFRETLLNEFSDKYFSGADNMYSSDMHKLLADAIDALKPEFRMVIMAIEFEGYSYEELSKETEIPVGTLLSRKHRALAKLYEMLKLYREKEL